MEMKYKSKRSIVSTDKNKYFLHYQGTIQLKVIYMKNSYSLKIKQ